MSVIVNRLPSDFLRQGWCRGAMAKNAQGEDVDPISPAATAWCLKGAIYAAHQGRANRIRSIAEFLDAIEARVGDSTTSWNDEQCRGQDEAVAVAQDIEEVLGYTTVLGQNGD